MTAITLPTDPAPDNAVPFKVSFDGLLTPFLGGEVQAIGRLGTRLGLRVTMPPIRGAVGRQFQARLLQGQTDRVLLPWPLLDLDPGSTGNPKINSSSSGTALSIKGLVAGYQFVEGQPLSVVSSSRRYMHLTTGAATANASGVAAVSIYPATRVTYAVDDVVEIETPIIEGLVSPGDEFSWEYAVKNLMNFAFSVVESK